MFKQHVHTGLRCIIGVNPWERERKQSVVMNIVFHSECGDAGHSDSLENTIDYRYAHLATSEAWAFGNKMSGGWSAKCLVRPVRPAAYWLSPETPLCGLAVMHTKVNILPIWSMNACGASTAVRPAGGHSETLSLWAGGSRFLFRPPQECLRKDSGHDRGERF